MHRDPFVTSARASLLASLFGIAVLAAAAPGCSTDTGDGSDGKKDIFADKREPVLVAEAVNADQAFADDAVVADDQITIVTAGHEKLLGKIEEGTVLAGNRSTKPVADDAPDLGPNPYGFLRRVKSIKKEGDKTVLLTEKASLDEWLQDGDIDFSSTKSLLDGTVAIAEPGTDGTTTTKSLHVLADDQQASSLGFASPALNASLANGGAGVQFSNAQFKVNAKYDGYLKVRYKELRFLPDPPTGVAMKSLLTLDPELSADIQFSFSGSKTLAEKEWNTRAVTIAFPTPIPVTVRLEPTIKCSLTGGGQVSVTLNAKFGAHMATGFEADVTFRHFDMTDLSKKATTDGGFTFKSVSGAAQLQGKCDILLKPIVLAFDAIGLQGKVGPYVAVTVNACTGISAGGANPGVTVQDEYGLSGEFGGRIQVPIIGVGKDFKALGIQIPFLQHYIYGDDKSCEPPPDKPNVDSCVSKADGFHCSQVNTYSGIICEGGSIAGGLSCADTTKKCTGGTKTQINCQ